ncbi:MAG: UDP-N-acetylglucosamine diphosphorylase [Methylacidiphilales bacterium]|nr:UDP-N-acetylglucosamine diphosphorylase [Candidatus Methylacidiphilales bacterium]MDW8349108.1 UDP-N-acetylglucosamine diphosphorylase [Verrucomicrobiae bacterium]
MDLSASALFDLQEFAHREIFSDCRYVWEAIPKIKSYLERSTFSSHPPTILGEAYIGEQVTFGEGVVVEPGAVILGPAIIGHCTRIRTGAYLRENVIIGENCILGNSCEFKNCILMNDCQVPHFSYVGDSILGNGVHLGAGVILSNLKLTGDEIVLHHLGKAYPTGLRKLGALIGDRAEIGCQAVLNPGSIIGRESLIYPSVVWRGILEERQIVKLSQTLQICPRRKV